MIFIEDKSGGSELAILQRITRYPCCNLQQGYIISCFASGIWLPTHLLLSLQEKKTHKK